MRILASPAFLNEKINPYNALLYRSIRDISNEAVQQTVSEYSHTKAIFEKYDIIHFHWPDGYVNQRSLFKSSQRALLLGLIILIAKLKGTKIVWTVHNVSPHDAFHPRCSGFFMRWFANRCNGLIFMSEESKATFLGLYKTPTSTQYAIIPHGHYRTSYPAAIDKLLAREQLGLSQDKKVLLFFGMIKPYKNIDTLIKLFIQAKLQDYVLVVAGNTDAELKEILHQEKNNHPDIHLFLRFIPDDQLHIYMSAADTVILPYRAILNSGALLLALSFNKPVIAPYIGAFAALQQELGTKWISCYSGELNTDALSSALQHLEQQERLAICPLENYEWSKLAISTLAFYQHLFPLSSHNKHPLIS